MTSRKYEQLPLFPFQEVAKNNTKFLNNLAILEENRRDGTFTVQVTTEERESFLNCALSIGAYITTHQLPALLCEAFESLTDKEGEFLKCTEWECDKPAFYFLECSCGTYAWCDEHIDNGVFLGHADHECSPECCKRKHTAERISIEELEKSLSSTKISIEETDTTDDAYNFVVKVRQKTAKELFDELEVLMDNYAVEELIGKLKNKIKCDEPPLPIGAEVVITPHFLSSQTLALAVVRYGEPIHAWIVEKKSNENYVCLLPQGVILPGHSQPHQESGHHCIVLSRSELTSVAS